jgi:GNAT superfamily N-acetyltransferase
MSGRPWPLVVRRALPGDRDAVMAFATNTWNGWDYMPRAWDRWLDEHDGVMLVGAVGGDGATDADGAPLAPGTVVAVVRVAMPATGEAWLEGIRVDPRVRGMDVATDLQVAELHWAAANGARIVRYATSARNEGSHRLGTRGGLELLVKLPGISWEPPSAGDEHEHPDQSGFDRDVQAAAQERRVALLDQFATAGWVASADDTASGWEWLDGDASFEAVKRLYEPRPWALEELTEKKFSDHVRRGEVIVRNQDDASRALAIVVRNVAPAEESAIRFALLAGSAADAWQIAEAASAGSETPVRFRYGEDSPVVAGFEQSYRDAGYTFSEWPLHIMARLVDDAHPVPEADPAAVILEDAPEAVITPAR